VAGVGAAALLATRHLEREGEPPSRHTVRQ
jgi:hypothetical protein